MPSSDIRDNHKHTCLKIENETIWESILGMTIDYDLAFGKHLNYVKKQIEK